MTDDKAKGQDPEARIERPEDEVQDLEPPKEESEDVQGGSKISYEYKYK